jgi:hypothetical protein
MANKGKKKQGKKKGNGGGSKRRAAAPASATPTGNVGKFGGRPNGSIYGRVAPARGAGYEATCALTDPFCPGARFARYPDNTSSRTLTNQIRASFFVSSDAQGECSFGIRPGIPYTWNIGTIAGLSSVVMGASWSAIAGAGYSNVYRFTSFGFRVMSNMVPTAEQGEVWVGTTGDAVWAGATYDLSANVNWYETFNATLKNGTITEWVAMPAGPNSRRFVGLNGSTDAADNPDTDTNWTNAVVACVGLPASTTNCVRVEVYANFEYIPSIGSAVAKYAQPSPPTNTTLQNAVGWVSRKFNSATAVFSAKESEDMRAKAASWAWDQAMRSAGSALAGYLTGGASNLLLGN